MLRRFMVTVLGFLLMTLLIPFWILLVPFMLIVNSLDKLFGTPDK